MIVYQVAVLSDVEERIRRLPPDVRRGVREAIRAIAEDPARGDPLRLELKDYMKYRVRRYRIVYSVDRRTRQVTLLAVGHRKTVYEQIAAEAHARSGN